LQRDALLYEIGSFSIYIKFNIKLPRTIWYSLEKKINLLVKFIRMPIKVEKCEFPGVNSPAYQYKSFCYLPVGSSRVLALKEVEYVKLLYDFRYQRTYLDTRGIVYFDKEKNVNYGIYSRSVVLEQINKLFNELGIKYRVNTVSENVILEIVKKVPPELLSFFTTKLIEKFGEDNKIKGKYTLYSLKIINVSGTTMIKLLTDPLPVRRVKPAVEEGKNILKKSFKFE